jgi:hypothetical protein
VSDDGAGGRSVRLGQWTLRVQDDGRVTAQLALPAPQRLECEFDGLRLRPGRPRAIEVTGPVSMRTAASGVADADAAIDACDALFDRLLRLARPAGVPRRRRRGAC